MARIIQKQTILKLLTLKTLMEITFTGAEHGMAAIMNGLALYGGIIPYGGLF